MVQYLLVFTCVVLAIDALVGDQGVLQMMKKRDDLRALQRKVAAAKAENSQMWLDIQRLKNDPAALEELARRDLGMIKPGEKLFIIKDAPPASPTPGSK
jgi:cell division protein FtsB